MTTPAKTLTEMVLEMDRMAREADRGVLMPQDKIVEAINLQTMMMRQTIMADMTKVH